MVGALATAVKVAVATALAAPAEVEELVAAVVTVVEEK